MKVLCLCGGGVFRSKYLAEYLENMGYHTSYAGVDISCVKNPASQTMVDRADVVILVHPWIKNALGDRKENGMTGKGYVDLEGKKIITLNVRDAFPEEGRPFEDVYSELEQQIGPYFATLLKL
ncbi:hypothetical protein A3K63_01655 [Candidatus Micrarchaeota archaeon RBG_16_49_10]|nr:MAG: hypothetical protein A3K63_01655 [Candidatus Micrarchaeota archaeon RBG_16_49_10]